MKMQVEEEDSEQMTRCQNESWTNVNDKERHENEKVHRWRNRERYEQCSWKRGHGKDEVDNEKEKKAERMGGESGTGKGTRSVPGKEAG